jgi:hypothetical protein
MQAIVMFGVVVGCVVCAGEWRRRRREIQFLAGEKHATKMPASCLTRREKGAHSSRETAGNHEMRPRPMEKANMEIF